MKPHLRLISGWAHDPVEMQPIADRLSHRMAVTLHAAHDFVDPQQEFSRLSAPPPVVLVGWSLGGMVAMQAASRLRVVGLVLISSMRRFCRSDDFPAGTPVGSVRALSRGLRRRPQETLQAFYAQAASPHRSPQRELEERAERALTADSAALQNGLTYLAQTDLGDTMGGLVMPTLILHGREDAVVAVAAAADLHERLPASELRLKDDIGHDLPLRDPDWVAQNIITFLTQHVDF